MVVRIPTSEQEQFSQRFQQALDDAGYQNESAARITQRFCRQYPEHAVSVYAVRKWLKGEAIPTQGKIQALATWLGVDAAWLRFDGDYSAGDSPKRAEAPISDAERQLLFAYRQLDPDERGLVERLIALFQRRSGHH